MMFEMRRYVYYQINNSYKVLSLYIWKKRRVIFLQEFAILFCRNSFMNRIEFTLAYFYIYPVQRTMSNSFCNNH